MRQKTESKPAEKKQKSRMLLHADPQNELENEFSFELANRVEEENSEEGRAITLKEAFDRTINKLNKEVEEEEDMEDLENMDADRFLRIKSYCSSIKCYAGYEACLKSTLTLSPSCWTNLRILRGDQSSSSSSQSIILRVTFIFVPRQYIDSSDLRQGDY